MSIKSALKAVSVVTLAGFFLLNSGCEQQDDLSMASAQSCLDTATTASQANTCVAKIAGIETADAYLVRCSANFIAQGFTGQRVATAYSRMSSSSSGTDPMLNIMAYLVFANADATNSVANAVTNCTKSGVLSMQQLVQVANLATTTSTLANVCNDGTLNCVDPGKVDAVTLVTKIKAAFTNTTAPNKAAVGTLALNLNSSFCGAGSNYASEDVCTYMSQAITAAGGTSDPAAVATQLISILSSKN